MAAFKSIIIDDDLVAGKILENYCQKSDHVQVVGIYEDPQRALAEFSETDANLIFLDIEMPGINGIEFLNLLPAIPDVIFTTSREDYAWQAFEYDAVDFLKKPFNYLRFQKAIQKAVSFQTPANDQSENTAPTEENDHIFIKEDGRLIRLELDDILYFENEGDYVNVQTNTGRHLIYKTMKSIEQSLRSGRFMRVHRTYIINTDKIVDIEETTLVINRKVIPIARSQRKTLMERLRVL